MRITGDYEAAISPIKNEQPARVMVKVLPNRLLNIAPGMLAIAPSNSKEGKFILHKLERPLSRILPHFAYVCMQLGQ